MDLSAFSRVITPRLNTVSMFSAASRRASITFARAGDRHRELDDDRENALAQDLRLHGAGSGIGKQREERVELLKDSADLGDGLGHGLGILQARADAGPPHLHRKAHEAGLEAAGAVIGLAFFSAAPAGIRHRRDGDRVAHEAAKIARVGQLSRGQLDHGVDRALHAASADAALNASVLVGLGDIALHGNGADRAERDALPASDAFIGNAH